jgi:predicted DsbA family dithiol-disulfide isomerase
MCNDAYVSEQFSIDVWSDVVCPFCYLGSRQLDLALEGFEHRDDVIITHHAFELDPTTPLVVERSLDEIVAAKYALPVEHAREQHRRLEAQAASLGVTMNFDRARATNTFDAHRLIALASTRGLGDAMAKRLFRAYFGEGRLISDHDQLDELAHEVGVDDASRLWTGDAYASDVRSDEAAAQDLGISGVPAFVVDRKFMVMGAQGAEKILDVLQRAWERRAA